MNKTKLSVLAASILAINACGGGGSGSVGIGGTGNGDPQDEQIVVQGTIDGFGSIFVNGIRFDIDSSEIEVDGNAATESQLAVGMVVTVRGSLSDDSNGTAASVTFDDDVQGPISAISENADGDTKTLTVLGVTVIASALDTIFDDVTYATLAIDDVIEVSGFVAADGSIEATRIEKKDTFQAGSSEIELKGTVTNLTANACELGGFVSEFDGADVSDVPNQTVENNQWGGEEGKRSGNTSTDSKVGLEGDGGFGDDDDVSVQGLITDFANNSSFRVLGTEVDASGATFLPSDLVLADNIVVEVEGTVSNGVLVANSVEIRGGNIELEALVSEVNEQQNSVTLGFATGSVTVEVNSSTRLDDQLFETPLTLADIQQGNFLEIKAIQTGDSFVATRLLRQEEADDDEIQGPVDEFITNTSITILGVTFTTTGAEFQDVNDLPISETAFYDQLSAGTIVKIKDDEVADGVADEVEFEND